MTRIVLLGAGGHAREVAGLLAACSRRDPGAYELLGFLVEPGFAAPGTRIDELPVLGDLSWLRGRDLDGLRGVCAVGSRALRRRLSAEAAALGLAFATVAHPTAVADPGARLGEGAVLAAHAVVGPGVRIGAHAHLNVASSVSHDGVLGDFVTLAPGARLAGGVEAGEGCFVGIGAVVVERRVLGEWSTVGAGAVVLDDVPPNATVAGVPARVVARRSPGWHLDPDAERRL